MISDVDICTQAHWIEQSHVDILKLLFTEWGQEWLKSRQCARESLFEQHFHDY